MTHDALLARRTQLLDQLQKHSIAVEQLKGALAFCDELLGGDPAEVPAGELNGKPLNDG